MMSTVFAFPPKLSCNTRVNFESPAIIYIYIRIYLYLFEYEKRRGYRRRNRFKRREDVIRDERRVYKRIKIIAGNVHGLARHSRL